MNDVDEIFDDKPKPEADSEEAESSVMAPADPAEEYFVDQLDREKIRIFDSENLARGRHKDYDNVVSDVVEAAKKDEKLALEIVTAPDPAQAAYDMGKKLKEGDLDDVMSGEFSYRHSIDQF